MWFGFVLCCVVLFCVLFGREGKGCVYDSDPINSLPYSGPMHLFSLVLY